MKYKKFEKDTQKTSKHSEEDRIQDLIKTKNTNETYILNKTNGNQ